MKVYGGIDYWDIVSVMGCYYWVMSLKCGMITGMIECLNV